jgi:hypothetical protein
MLFRTVGAIAIASAIAMPAAAQSQVQVEVGVTGGYTASDGITTANARIINGKSYNEIAPVSAGSFGLTFGVYVNHHAEVEFLYARQFSKLEASGVNAVLDISNLNVDSYFGNFVYNWDLHDGMIRPFAFGGLGATHYAEGSSIAPPPVGSRRPPAACRSSRSTGAAASSCIRHRTSALRPWCAWFRPTSSRIRQASGATRTSVAGRSATRSTRTSSSSRVA